MGRSLKYDIPGIEPRVQATEVAERGWASLFAEHRARHAAAGSAGAGAADVARSIAGAAHGERSVDAPASTRSLRPRVLEIGFGRGEFLLGLAAAAPEVDFVGLEVSFKRTLKMARKVARAGLANVLLLEARAEDAVRELFAPAELTEVWINFSDPWPKARHAPRRLIQPGFVEELVRVLAPGGALHVATDDVPYAHQIDAVLSDAKELVNQLAPWPFESEIAGRPVTGYEAQWRDQARPLHFFEYARREAPVAPVAEAGR